MNIEDQVKIIDDHYHYLKMACTENLEYFDSFIQCITDLSKKINEKQLNDLLKNKLQSKQGAFSEKQFIQSACETTVNSYFAKYYGDSFQYELKVNPRNHKNIECQFKDRGFTYNIEVKCATYEMKEKIDQTDAFRFSTFGRMENYKDIMNELGDLLIEGQRRNGAEPKPLVESKKMDNTLKDFLLSAQKKYNPSSNENELNILIVCCGDALNMQEWHNYMHAPHGLFTEHPFYDYNEYSLTDVVVLTNLYHRHNKYYDKPHLKDIWNFSAAFNLVASNPWRKLEKSASIYHWLKIFPHFTNELDKHKIAMDDEPEFMHDIMKGIVGIPDFVRVNFTDKGVRIF